MVLFFDPDLDAPDVTVAFLPLVPVAEPETDPVSFVVLPPFEFEFEFEPLEVAEAAVEPCEVAEPGCESVSLCQCFNFLLPPPELCCLLKIRASTFSSDPGQGQAEERVARKKSKRIGEKSPERFIVTEFEKEAPSWAKDGL